MFGHDNYRQFATVSEIESGGVVLHVFGDVDLSSAAELNEAIDDIALRDADVPLLINLSRCRYFDSSGLAALLRARTLFGRRLTVVTQAKSQILRVMRIVGFDELLNVVTELHPSGAIAKAPVA